IPHHNAFPLTDAASTKGHPTPDEFKRRDRDLRWADEDALSETNWRLVIRRWRIVSRLNFQGPETVIAEGIQSAPGPKVEQEIIPKEVKVRIELEPKKPYLAQVHIEFERDEILNKRREREEILLQSKNDKSELEELKKKTPAEAVTESIRLLEKRISDTK